VQKSPPPCWNWRQFASIIPFVVGPAHAPPLNFPVDRNSESTVTVLPSIAVFFHGTYRGAQSVVPPNSIHQLHQNIVYIQSEDVQLIHPVNKLVFRMKIFAEMTRPICWPVPYGSTRYLWYCGTTVVPSVTSFRRYWYREKEVPRFHKIKVPWYRPTLAHSTAQCLHCTVACRLRLLPSRWSVMASGGEVSLKFSVHKYSSYSSNYFPEYVFVNFGAAKDVAENVDLQKVVFLTDTLYTVITSRRVVELYPGKVFRIGTVRYNWPVSAHASQAFSIAHCTDSEDLPRLVLWTQVIRRSQWSRKFRESRNLKVRKCEKRLGNHVSTWALG